jgi:hypothetical protein
VLYFLKRHASRAMLATGFCLFVAAPVWLKSLDGSSLDWTGISAVQLWFRQGPVPAFVAAGAMAIFGLLLLLAGAWQIARDSKRQQTGRCRE